MCKTDVLQTFQFRGFLLSAYNVQGTCALTLF